MNDKFANGTTGYHEQPSIDDLLQPYEMRIEALEEFIKKARQATNVQTLYGGVVFMVPEWFVTDDIV